MQLHLRRTQLSLLCTACSLLLCASCGQSPEPENATHRFVEPSSTEGTLHLQISTQAPIQLRSTSEPSDPMQRIRSLRFLFYNSEDVLSVIRDQELQSASQLSDLSVRLPIGDYKLVVIAGATEAITKQLQEGSPLSRLTDELALSSSDLIGTDRIETIPLLNARGPISISKAQFASSSAALPLTLEPLLARVLVYGTPQLGRGAHKGAANAGYLLTAQRKQLTLLRPLALLRSGAMERYDDSSKPEDRYPKDSHYDAWSAQAPSDASSFFAYYSPQLYLDPERQWNSCPTSSSETAWIGDSGRYAKESTLPPSCYLRALVPTICYRYPYIPADLTLSGKEGWISFRGQHYSETAFRKMLQTKKFPDHQLQEAVTRAKLTEASLAKAFDKEGIAFYHEAANYYYIPIRHFEDSAAPTASSIGRYGLVRGCQYLIEVTKLSSPGMAVPSDLSKDMRPVQEDKSLSFSLSVQPLVTLRHEVQL